MWRLRSTPARPCQSSGPYLRSVVCVYVCVSACVIHSSNPIKNDLRVFLKRPNLSNNTLTWRTLATFQFLGPDFRFTQARSCPQMSFVSIISVVSYLTGCNKRHICTFNLHQRGIFPHWVLKCLPAVNEVVVWKHLQKDGLSFFLSLAVSRLGLSHILQNVAPVMELYCTLMRQKQQFPRRQQGRRLFLALELQKLSLLHLQFAESLHHKNDESRVVVSWPWSTTSWLDAAKLQGWLKATDATTCNQNSLLDLPTILDWRARWQKTTCPDLLLPMDDNLLQMWEGGGRGGEWRQPAPFNEKWRDGKTQSIEHQEP